MSRICNLDKNSKATSNLLVFYVNGKKVQDDHINPEWTLLDYLRNTLRLCGTKSGCADGNCGACTVMVSRYNRKQDKEIHIPVIACFAPICSMHGLAITTIEGIGSTKTKLHPIQKKLAEAHRSLCGFCSPGFVMSLYTLLRNCPKPTLKDIEECVQGNLCRCGGYRPILDSYKMSCAKGRECCRLQTEAQSLDSSLTCPGENPFTLCHPSQEIIFPPDLKINDSYEKVSLKIEGPNTTWYRPTTIEELLDLKSKFPNALIMVGNTEIGLETKFKNKKFPVLISPSGIEEMTEITETPTGVRIGASATIAEVEKFLKCQIAKQPEQRTRIFKALLETCYWFGSKQVRNVGTMAGNIVSGSPVADTLPILTAIKTKLEVISASYGFREVVMDENYFTGYRKSTVKQVETILAIHIPFTDNNQHCLAFKQARNKENDITIVHAAIYVKFEENSTTIEEISFGFGGLSYKVVTAPKTQKELVGLNWGRQTLKKAYHYLLEDLALGPATPGGKIRYRNSLILSLFLKMFLGISEKINEHIYRREMSAVRDFPAKKYKMARYLHVIPSSNCLEPYKIFPRSNMSSDSQMQACGEITYCDDILFFENELYVSFVLSSKSHAKILNIDTTDAVQVNGVRGIVSAEDITEMATDKSKPCWCYIQDHHQIFTPDKVASQGQIICGIVASDKFSAQEAAKKVKIEYEELKPVVVTIQDAIKYSSFFANNKVIKGDSEDLLKEAPYWISDECSIGGQKHFYFESQCGIIVPGGDELTVYVSTETPEDIKMSISEMLRIPKEKVKVKVKKLGGSFGGKGQNTTCFALAAAVAAKKFNHPVRYVVDHYDDAIVNGGRHPFTFKYNLGFNEIGKILACEVEAYCNVGCFKSFGTQVMDRALIHLQHALDFPFFKAMGYSCKTNLPPFTLFRGLGAPQAVYVAHCLTDEICNHLENDVIEVVRINICHDTHLVQCFEECIRLSNYLERRKAVVEFNRNNCYKKRGISVVPMKYATNLNITHEKDKAHSFTYWAGCSEVEIDTLTGDHQLLRTDIVANLGTDLSTEIDITLVEGAFIQGYGLFALEECVYSATGSLITRGPATYKIPVFTDIPEEFNVFILQETTNDPGALVQQDIDEPALSLASSVFFAIKNAARAARTANAVKSSLKLDPPATVEKVRLACEDDIIAMVDG